MRITNLGSNHPLDYHLRSFIVRLFGLSFLLRFDDVHFMCNFKSLFRNLTNFDQILVRLVRSFVEFGLENVCLHTFHNLGIHDLFSDLFATCDKIPDNDNATEDNFEIRVGNGVQQAFSPLNTLEFVRENQALCNQSRSFTGYVRLV